MIQSRFRWPLRYANLFRLSDFIVWQANIASRCVRIHLHDTRVCMDTRTGHVSSSRASRLSNGNYTDDGRNPHDSPFSVCTRVHGCVVPLTSFHRSKIRNDDDDDDRADDRWKFFRSFKIIRNTIMLLIVTIKSTWKSGVFEWIISSRGESSILD